LNEGGEVFYLVGNYNVDLLKCNSNSRSSEFLELLFSFGLLQIVTKPTRCTDNSASLIDHIITYHYVPSYTSVILTSKISDHFPVLYFLPSKSTTEKPKSFTSCDFSLENMSKFENSISTIKWNFVRDEPDAQSAFNAFLTFFIIFIPCNSL